MPSGEQPYRPFPHFEFTFLGFMFRPGRLGASSTGYSPFLAGMNSDAMKRMRKVA
jgi:hypothetical protein